MHLEDVIKPVWRCTRRPYSSEFGDALGGDDYAKLEAVIGRVWRCTLEAVIVTAQEGTKVLGKYRRKIRKVWKELCYG